VRPVQLFGAAAIVVGRLNSPALAQANSAVPHQLPAEVGVALDAARMREGLYLDTAMVLEPMLNVRLTKPLTANVALEGTFALAGASSSDYDTKGFFTVQIKHRLWRPSRSDIEVFATYGGAGVWRQDRIYDRSGTTWIRNAVLPFYAVVGAGLQWEAAARAAIRTEIQGVGLAWAPVGVRISTGVSIPFAPYRP
jgi:hypothetical protein